MMAASIAQYHPVIVGALEFNRNAIGAGQWWRLVTGHLVHYGWPHMAADMSVFVALCWIAGRRGTGVLRMTAVAIPVIGAAIYFCSPATITYRGMSGVDAALFGWVLVTMATERGGWRSVAYVGMLVLAVGRFAFETATGQSLLPTSLPEDIAVVGSAHLAGLAVGCAMAILDRYRAGPRSTSLRIRAQGTGTTKAALWRGAKEGSGGRLSPTPGA